MARNNITVGVSYPYPYSHIPLTTICILGVVSNVLLLLAFFKDPLKCFRNSATHFVTNLSISDCLTCLFALFFDITEYYMTPENHEIISFLIESFACVSLVSLTSISIDRFLMVAYPIKHRILMKGKVIVLCVAVIWIFGCSLSGITLLFGRQNKIYIYHSGAVAVTLSAVIYAATYHKLKKQSRNIALQNSSESRAQEIRILKEKKFLNTIILIACVAFLCIMPFMVLSRINSNPSNLRGNILVIEIFTKIFLFFFYANFAVNPIIYVIRLPNYRKTFYLLYWRRAR